MAKILIYTKMEVSYGEKPNEEYGYIKEFAV